MIDPVGKNDTTQDKPTHHIGALHQMSISPYEITKSPPDSHVCLDEISAYLNRKGLRLNIERTAALLYVLTFWTHTSHSICLPLPSFRRREGAFEPCVAAF